MATAKSSGRTLAAPSLKTTVAIGCAARMAACASRRAPAPAGPLGATTPATPTDAAVSARGGVTPPFMRGRNIVRVGLLLPSSLRPQEAAALYNAAELALF